METDKPKRKRKSGEGRSLRWIAAGALVLVIAGLAGAYLYWRTQPPMPILAEPMTPTPAFVMPEQCSITQTYQMQIKETYNPYDYRTVVSPKKTYFVNFDPSGVFLKWTDASLPPVKLMPAFGDTIYQQIYWSDDESRLAFLNGSKLMVANGDGSNPQLIHEPVTEIRGFAHDGSSLVFNDGEVMWLASADGREKRPITAPATDTSYYNVFTWSDDSRYVVRIKGGSESDTMTILPVDEAQPIVIDGNWSVYQDNIVWSPDGKNVAFFASDSYGNLSTMVIAALDGSVRYDVMLPAGSLMTYNPLLWSPDSQKIALVFSAPTGTGINHGTFSIYGLDGSSYPEVGKNLLDYYERLNEVGVDVPPLQELQWSEDSRYFYYLESEGSQTVFHRFDTTNGTAERQLDASVEALFYVPATDAYVSYGIQPGGYAQLYSVTREGAYTDLTPPLLYATQPPVWSDNARHAYAIKGHWENHQHIVVTDLTNNSQHPLVPELSADAGDPLWSPNGNFVAATYALLGMKPEERRVYLVWMNRKTHTMRTLDDAFLSVYNLAWSADERYIAYVAWRSGGTSLEVVDTTTGQHRTLVAKADSISAVGFDAERGHFTAIWQTNDRPVYQEFAPDGTAFMALTLDPGTSRHTFFWSPDGKSLAVKQLYKGSRSYTENQGTSRTYYATNYESLRLSSNSNSSVILASELVGLGDPTWSPDSRLVAFTQFTDARELALVISDAAGKVLWQTPIDRLYTFAWAPCAAE